MKMLKPLRSFCVIAPASPRMARSNREWSATRERTVRGKRQSHSTRLDRTVTFDVKRNRETVDIPRIVAKRGSGAFERPAHFSWASEHVGRLILERGDRPEGTVERQ